MDQHSRSDDRVATDHFRASFQQCVRTIANPLFLFGSAIGLVVGIGICWVVFVLPFQHNLAERETELENWSRLNQQMQQQTQENRELSQGELKQFVAANRESAADFQQIQEALHQRELRLTETPISFILIPLAILIVACIGVVAVLRALNQRALSTVEHVLHMAPPEILQNVVRRHIVLESPRASQLIGSGPSDSTLDDK